MQGLHGLQLPLQSCCSLALLLNLFEGLKGGVNEE
jgi:hypothetical protein